MLMEGRDGEADTNSVAYMNTFRLCFPTEGTLTEEALPVTVVAIILQPFSMDRLLQVSTLLTTSLSPHTHILTHWVWADTQDSTPVSTTTTHIRNQKRTFHPRFTLHKLMAWANQNYVLVHTSCSSLEKNTYLGVHASVYKFQLSATHVLS